MEMQAYSEKQLVEEFQGLLARYLEESSTKFILETEVSAGRSIADIVALITPEIIDPPIKKTLNALESVIISTLRQNGSTRIDILEKRCGMPQKSLRNGSINRLINWGLVDKGPGGRISLTNNWSNHYRIIAIEAKLYKWQQALEQAISYKKYADDVYVLLPAKNTPLDQTSIEKFKANGVGLITICQNKIKIVIPSVYNQFHDWSRDFVLSRLLVKGKSDLRDINEKKYSSKSSKYSS